MEVVWTLVGLGGAYFSVPFCWKFRGRWLAYQRGGAGKGERILAQMYLVVGALMVESHAVIVVMGVTAMTILPTTNAPVTPTGVVITVGIICLGVTAVLVSWWMSRSHARLIAHLNKGGIP